jgi:hypothetical protein
MQRLASSMSVVAEMLVNNSGRDVMADNKTPPKNAPDNLVERSIISM